MANYTTSSSAGISFTGLLTLIFIALKLMGYITWSWIWVLSPLWIGFSFTLITVLLLTLALMRSDQKDQGQ